MAFIAPLAIPLMIAGAGVTAASTISGGIAKQDASNYQAAIASNNAIGSGQQAEYAANAGQVKAARQSMKGAAEGGRLKTSQAANGVNVNTGSAVDAQVAQREGAKLDTETVINNADLTAYGYRRQADNFKAQEAMDRATADNAVPAAALSAAGGLLSSAGSVGFKWAGSNSQFGFGGFNDNDNSSDATEAEKLAGGVRDL